MNKFNVRQFQWCYRAFTKNFVLCRHTGSTTITQGDDYNPVFTEFEKCMTQSTGLLKELEKHLEDIHARRMLCEIFKVTMSITVDPSIVDTLGPSEVSFIVRCMHFRGIFISRKHI